MSHRTLFAVLAVVSAMFVLAPPAHAGHGTSDDAAQQRQDPNYPNEITGPTVPVPFNSGNRLTITIPMGATQPGTLYIGSANVTNNSSSPQRFTLRQPPSITGSGAANVDIVGSDVPEQVELAPGESFPLSVRAGVPLDGTAAANPSIRVYYDVSQVYDQVWRDSDFDYFLGDESVETINASSPCGGPWGTPGMVPGGAYYQHGVFTNDLPHPVRVTYVGYSDDGTIAPYISGTLKEWAQDGIVLQPGESTDRFTMYFGMPYFIGNESQGTSGTVSWCWRAEPVAPPEPPVVDDHTTTPAGEPVYIDVLANDAVANGTLTSVEGDNGIWEIVDGRIRYTPAPGFSGTATATYTVTDESGRTHTATITVTVEAAEPQPEPSPEPTDPPTEPDEPTDEGEAAQVAAEQPAAEQPARPNGARPLAVTGMTTGPLTAAGVLAVVLGAALLAVTRRRHNS